MSGPPGTRARIKGRNRVVAASGSPAVMMGSGLSTFRLEAGKRCFDSGHLDRRLQKQAGGSVRPTRLDQNWMPDFSATRMHILVTRVPKDSRE